MIPINPAVVEVVIDSIVELSDTEKEIILSRTRALFEGLKLKVVTIRIRDKTYG